MASLLFRTCSLSKGRDNMPMSSEAFGFRFYRLRRNPWRHTDRMDTVAGTLYKPADYTGDYRQSRLARLRRSRPINQSHPCRLSPRAV